MKLKSKKNIFTILVEPVIDSGPTIGFKIIAFGEFFIKLTTFLKVLSHPSILESLESSVGLKPSKTGVILSSFKESVK